MHQDDGQEIAQAQISNSEHIVQQEAIQDLVKQLTTKEVLEAKIQNLLVESSDRFMDNILTFACKLAKHRGSDTLEVGDVKFAFEKLT